MSQCVCTSYLGGPAPPSRALRAMQQEAAQASWPGGFPAATPPPGFHHLPSLPPLCPAWYTWAYIPKNPS